MRPQSETFVFLVAAPDVGEEKAKSLWCVSGEHTYPFAMSIKR